MLFIVTVVVFSLLLVFARFVERRASLYLGFGPFLFAVSIASIGPLLYSCPFLSIKVDPPSLSFYAVYVFCIFIFLVGGFLGPVFVSSIGLNSFGRAGTVNNVKLIPLILTGCIISLVVRFGFIAKQIAEFGVVGIFKHGVESYQMGVLDTRKSADGIPGIINLIETVFNASSIVFMVLSIYIALAKRKAIPRAIWLLFCVFALIFIFLGMASGNRVQTVIPILAVALTVYGGNLKRYLPALFLVGTSIFLIVVTLTFSRDRIFSETGTRSYERSSLVYLSVKGVPDSITYSPIGSLFSTLGFYFGHSFWNSSYLTENRQNLNKSLGVQSFRGVGFIYRAAPPVYYRAFGANSSNSMFREALNIEIQWVGWFGNFLMDFGLLGVPVCFFSFGVWFSSVAMLRHRLPDFFGDLTLVSLFICAWSIIVTPPFASFIYWPFAVSTVLFILLRKQITRWFGAGARAPH